MTDAIKIIAENRKARFNYEIIETIEAGLVLTGAEIKSVRLGQVQLSDSYVRPEGTGMVLVNMEISPYLFSTQEKDYEPKKKRGLLLNASEINTMRGQIERKGLTLIPLKVYLKHGKAKVELALARGKAAPDKRDSIKKREATREAERAMKRGK